MKDLKSQLISLFAASLVLVVVSLYPLYRPDEEPPAEIVNHTIAEELNVNFLTSSFKCSHYGKEWHICTQPTGWGGMLYCPAYSEYNETELSLVEWGEMGVPTPLHPCFTCPKAGTSCADRAEEVMAGAGIPEDLNSTLAEFNLWDDAEWYCEQLCEKQKEGESCNEDNLCTVRMLMCMSMYSYEHCNTIA
jgi:hypothetical protein